MEQDNFIKNLKIFYKQTKTMTQIYRLICKQIRAEETNLFVRPISFELSSSHVNQSQFLTLYTDDNDYYFDSLDRLEIF